MEFLQLVENIESDRASTAAIFRGEGTPVSKMRRDQYEYKVRLAEAARFMGDVFAGRRRPERLVEAMSTDDFPLLFADILDRQVLAAYQEWPAVWRSVARQVTVRDFRPARLDYGMLGGDARLTRVAELEEYPEAALTEVSPFSWSVRKYGRTMAFSWEAMINDELDRLKDVPERFGRAARRTENRTVVEMYVDANGPHASLYTSGNKNIINTSNGASANNPPLTIAGVQDAYLVLSKLVDDLTGEPIQIEMVNLVVPPALEIVARNILNAVQLLVTAAAAGGVRDNGTTGKQELVVANWMRDRTNLVVDPYIPLTATSANGNRSWFMFADPNRGREAIRVGFLRGHEQPELFMKDPDARRIGGGDVNAMDGDFRTDSIQYKVRHVLGATYVDPKATVTSNGSGS